MEGGDQPQSGRQRVCKLWKQPHGVHWCHFTSTYHTKQLNPWPNPSANRVVNYSWLSIYPGEMEPLKDHLNTRGCLTNLRNKPQQSSLGNFQHQYLSEMLVYGYHVTMKSVSSCCVHGSQIFSSPVTY